MRNVCRGSKPSVWPSRTFPLWIKSFATKPTNQTLHHRPDPLRHPVNFRLLPVQITVTGNRHPGDLSAGYEMIKSIVFTVFLVISQHFEPISELNIDKGIIESVGQTLKEMKDIVHHLHAPPDGNKSIDPESFF